MEGMMTPYLGGAGAELEKTGLALGRSGFILEFLDFAALGFSLLLQPSDSNGVLRRAYVPVTHARHD